MDSLQKWFPEEPRFGYCEETRWQAQVRRNEKRVVKVVHTLWENCADEKRWTEPWWKAQEIAGPVVHLLLCPGCTTDYKIEELIFKTDELRLRAFPHPKQSFNVEHTGALTREVHDGEWSLFTGSRFLPDAFGSYKLVPSALEEARIQPYVVCQWIQGMGIDAAAKAVTKDSKNGKLIGYFKRALVDTGLKHGCPHAMRVIKQVESDYAGMTVREGDKGNYHIIFFDAVLAGACEAIELLFTGLSDQVVKGLLDKKDFKGDTAYHLAAREGNVEMMVLLAEHWSDDWGSSFYLGCCGDGLNPLYLAVMNGHPDAAEAAIELCPGDLRSKLCDLKGEISPLTLCVRSEDVPMIERLSAVCRKRVWRKWCASPEWTPLHEAAKEGKAAVIAPLLRLWPGRFKATLGYRGLLHSIYSVAARCGQSNVLSEIHEIWPDDAPHDLFRPYLGGLTPVHLAALGGHADCVRQTARECPADLENWVYTRCGPFRDPKENSPLEIAWNSLEYRGQLLVARRSETEPLKLIPGGGNPFHLAISTGDLDTIEAVASVWPKKAVEQPFVDDGHGRSPLLIAVQLGDEKVFHRVVDMCPVELMDEMFTSDKRGDSLMHVAAKGGNEEMMKAVFERCPENVASSLFKKNHDGLKPKDLVKSATSRKLLRKMHRRSWYERLPSLKKAFRKRH